jgi:HEAT repeat protein
VANLSWCKEVATGNDYEDIPMKKNHVCSILVCLLVLVAGSVRADEEQDLITILKSNADIPQKCDACFRLRIIGTAKSVPVLAALLGQERLSQAARNALEALPYQEAGRALRQALSESCGSIKAGLIDSLGWRRESQAVSLLAPLLSDGDVVVASAAASALGKIGGDEAVAALRAAAGDARPPVHATALESLLQCADRLQATGNQSGAGKIYRDLFDGKHLMRFRMAAWRGLVLSDAGSRKTLMVEALRESGHPARQAALKLIRELDDEQATQACAQQWDSLAADAQLAVLDASVKQGRNALPLVSTALNSPYPAVQVAALEAAGCVGDAKLVAVLAERAASGTETEQAAARRSLSRLSADGVDRAILSLLGPSDPTIQVEAIDAVRERGTAIAVAGRPLLDQARGGAPQVQQAALRALGDLSGTEQMSDLVAMLATEKNSGQADEVVKALVATAHRVRAEDRAATLVLQQLPKAEGSNRAAMLVALAQLGSPTARPALKRALGQADDSQLREDALRALVTSGRDDSFVPDLLEVARASDKQVHRVLALRAAVRLIDQGNSSADAKVRQLRQVMQAAERADEKRAALAALARIQTPAAMELACEHVSDASLRAEAAQATVQIAQAISHTEPRKVAAALRIVAAAPVSAERREQAEGLLLEVASVQSYLRQWEVAGPYMKEGQNHAQLFDIPFAPEEAEANVEWKPIAVRAEGNHPAYVDLLAAFGGEQRVAYLRTQIESTELKLVTLEIFSDDGVKAWLNGQLVHANNVARPIMPEPDPVNVTLHKGTNNLMLKVTQNNLPWGVIVRVREGIEHEGANDDSPLLGEGFKLHVINADSRFEAAGILDVNRDGKPDIFCGGFWYEAPDWKPHFVCEIKEEGDYYYDFANLPMDVDGDGWTDIVNAAWHNKMVFWERNPGPSGGAWELFAIDTPGNIETALAVDINGDGQLDILPNIMSQAAWYEFHRDASAPQGVRWQKHPLAQEAAGHGLGAGDVNRDGRCDVVAPKGWLEQTADGWQWHAEFELGSTSIPILVHDVDADGDADIIWGLGHNYGLFWLEQKVANGQRAWEKHPIDDSWSQPHFMLMADLDNDGRDELVTGKRYHAHNGHDPGGNDPRCVYYYSFDTAGAQWTRHTMHEGGAVGFGINTAAADMDGDGDLDVVAPGKSGLYLFENVIKSSN